jgi:hypothetical protein
MTLHNKWWRQPGYEMVGGTVEGVCELGGQWLRIWGAVAGNKIDTFGGEFCSLGGRGFERGLGFYMTMFLLLLLHCPL